MVGALFVAACGLVALAEKASAGSPGAPAPRVVELTDPIDHPIEFVPGITMSLAPASSSLDVLTMNGVALRRGSGGTFTVSDVSAIYGRAASQPDAAEDWLVDLPPGTHAVELRLHEPTVPAQCGNPDCFDTLYRVEVLRDSAVIHSLDYSPYNDLDNVLRLWSEVPLDQVRLRATLNNTDDEYLGDIRISAVRLPAGYPTRLPTSPALGIGRSIARHGDQLLAGHESGVLAFRRGGDGSWQAQGGISSVGRAELAAVDEQFAVWIVGNTLHIRAHAPGDASGWESFAPITVAGSPTDLAAANGIIAVGSNALGVVQLFGFEQISRTWSALPDLQPTNPIADTTSFGHFLGIDGDLLVVGASRDAWYLYQRGPSSDFNEVHRHTLANGLGPTNVDIADGVVVNQLLGGGSAHIHFRDAGGAWGYRTFVAEPQLAGEQFSAAEGLAVGSGGLVLLRSFFTPASPNRRFIASMYQRESVDRWTKVGVVVDPHLKGVQSPLFGATGRAIAIDTDEVLIGQPSPHRCDDRIPPRLGDPSPESGCLDLKSGAVFQTTLDLLAEVFADGMEAAAAP